MSTYDKADFVTLSKPPQVQAPCTNKNCPKHFPQNQEPIAAEPKEGLTKVCENKNCPKHGTPAIVVPNVDTANPSGGTITTREKLGIRIAKTGMGPSPTTVMAFITTNNNNYGGDGRVSPAPTLVPPSERSPRVRRSTSPSPSDLYDQMKLEHTRKENEMLHSLIQTQTEEITGLKVQLESTTAKLLAVERDFRRLRKWKQMSDQEKTGDKSEMIATQVELESTKARLLVAEKEISELRQKKKIADQQAAEKSESMAKLKLKVKLLKDVMDSSLNTTMNMSDISN